MLKLPDPLALNDGQQGRALSTENAEVGKLHSWAPMNWLPGMDSNH
jgi:hypothetical protein